MLARHFGQVTLVAVVLMAPWLVGAANFGTYREFTLGASTAEVIAQGRAADRDLKTLHERPALLQEISWRPPYTSGRDAAERDSVSAIVFSFVDNQLFRMAIDYDRARTEGLTNEDMIASLSAVHGAASVRPAPATSRSAFESLDARSPVARWQQGDTTIELTHSPYSRSFGLVITSVPLEARARKAQATAITMDAREAPAREAARAKADTDAARAAAEKTRTTNKATFKP
jgi:hypothetical protein